MSDPDPLTPPDCDLRGLPFMPMDVVRLLDSDLFALSTGEEFKAALALWCKAWLQVPAASLPDDDRVLAHLSGAGSRWKKLRPMALRGWVKCSDGRFYHPVVASKAADAWKHRLAQRERANKRWQNQDDSGGNATGDATAYSTAMQGRGRGTVEGKAPSPQASELSPTSEPPRATDCFNEVCKVAAWSPDSDSQRAENISVLAGWLALGCSLETILLAVSKARKRDPSPTRSLKRFDSTVRGMRRDQLGGQLPATSADVRAMTQGIAGSLRA